MGDDRDLDVFSTGRKPDRNLGEAVAARTSHRRPPALPHLTVATFPAQPLAALPPYGCGVPFTGSERLVQRSSTAEVLWSPPHSPDVSLRGPEGAVAISGRHLQFARATEKTHKPIASVAALTERHWQLQILKQFRRPCRFPDLSLRGAKRRGNLGKALAVRTGYRKTAQTNCVCSGAH